MLLFSQALVVLGLVACAHAGYVALGHGGYAGGDLGGHGGDLGGYGGGFAAAGGHGGHDEHVDYYVSRKWDIEVIIWTRKKAGRFGNSDPWQCIFLQFSQQARICQ